MPPKKGTNVKSAKLKPMPMAKSPKINPTGNWTIIEMENWDSYCDALQEPGYIEFVKGRSGCLHFDCVQADLDWRLDLELARVEFSFTGYDDGTEISGRGWAKVDGDKLNGKIFIHQGDDSGFKANR